MAIISFFSMPTPCSPVMEPPTEMQCSRISSLALLHLFQLAGDAVSNRIRGCRLPSPAWKMLLMISP